MSEYRILFAQRESVREMTSGCLEYGLLDDQGKRAKSEQAGSVFYLVDLDGV